MAKSSFYNHLMMVTVVHMLKAHGFTRSSGRPVEVLTDLAARFINLLITTVEKYARLRNDTEPNVQDITKAFIELKIIFPAKRLDLYDLDSSTDIGINDFERWFNGSMNQRMREVARPNSQSLEFRRETRRKMNGVNYRMHDLAKMLDQQNKEAQMQNPTMPYTSAASGKASLSGGLSGAGVNEPVFNSINSENEEQNLFSDAKVDDDWIQFLLRDQITDQVMTQKLKLRASDSLAEQKPTVFKGTVFADYIPKDLQQYVQGDVKPNSDFIIRGPLPEQLMHTFPYYKSDIESDDEDFEDEIDKEIENEEEISKMEAKELETYDYFEHHNGLEDRIEDTVIEDNNQHSNTHLNLFG